MAMRTGTNLKAYAFATPKVFFDVVPPFGSERSDYFGIVRVDFLPSMIGDRTTL